MKDGELSPLEKLVKEIQQAGQDWVEAKLRADQLDKDEKNFLAALQNGLEDKSKEKLSEAKLERLARGSSEFRSYVTNLCVAKAEAERRKVRYENLQSFWETKRSELALEREKIAKGIYEMGG